MTTKPTTVPDVRSKWSQRSMEIGFLFGAILSALMWLAAGFRYALIVSFGQESLAPGPIVFGIMASLMTIPLIGFCTAILFGVVVFFAELAVRSASRGREPDVRALSGILHQAERRFAASTPAEPPADAIHPPDGLAAPPPASIPIPPNEEIQP